MLLSLHINIYLIFEGGWGCDLLFWINMTLNHHEQVVFLVEIFRIYVLQIKRHSYLIYFCLSWNGYKTASKISLAKALLQFKFIRNLTHNEDMRCEFWWPFPAGEWNRFPPDQIEMDISHAHTVTWVRYDSDAILCHTIKASAFL